MKRLNWFQRRWLDFQRLFGFYEWNFNKPQPVRDEWEFDRIDREW